MESELSKIINTNKLICSGDVVILGVSGGADSVAMLRALHNLSSDIGCKVVVAHLNHGIRVTAADDAQFVKALCEELILPFYMETVDVTARAKKDSLSVEMAAREERYEFFTRAAARFDTNLLATAHTADDQAETVLLKLIRGAGIDGLSGIALNSERNGLRIIRPLLNVNRSAIENYLRTLKQEWRDDLSNNDTVYLRNKVRHELLPWIKNNLNSAIKETLCRTANILYEENCWLNELTAKIADDVLAANNTLLLDKLAGMPVAARRRVIRHWLDLSGVDISLIDYKIVNQIDDLLCRDSNGTKYLPLPGEYRVIRQYDIMKIEKFADNQLSGLFNKIMVVPGEIIIPEISVKITAEIKPGIIKNCKGRIGSVPAESSISFERVGDSPIIVRTWQPGDKIKPLGITGTQKLQDIFVNERVPVDERSKILVFECKGEIIWIPNYRVARGWEVLPDDKKAVRIKIKTA